VHEQPRPIELTETRVRRFGSDGHERPSQSSGLQPR
jgi:hypothetical protein